MHVRPLADVHLKKPWDLMCDPNICASCHATHTWKEVCLWDQGLDPYCAILSVRGDPRIMILGTLHWQLGNQSSLLPVLGTYWSHGLRCALEAESTDQITATPGLWA